jgi:hypothetical protein
MGEHFPPLNPRGQTFNRPPSRREGAIGILQEEPSSNTSNRKPCVGAVSFACHPTQRVLDNCCDAKEIPVVSYDEEFGEKAVINFEKYKERFCFLSATEL